jgi:hypothetical protein
MESKSSDSSVITFLSLDREVVRDLTSEEMNGANGGNIHEKPQPDTPIFISVLTCATTIVIIYSIHTVAPK